MGELKQATAYTINVDNGSVISLKTAITILKVNRRDKIASAVVSTIAAGARTTINDTPGSGIDRVIIQVHPPSNATINVEVVQGNSSFATTCNGDTDLVFDAIP
jgi:hypothetical protein